MPSLHLHIKHHTDEHLTWDKQIQQIALKLSKNVGILAEKSVAYGLKCPCLTLFIVT
jgi:hypothetical protein